MQKIESINEMQSLAINLRNEMKLIGFVPTLGGIHEGHLSLIDYAKNKADIVVASIYLNPDYIVSVRENEFLTKDLQCENTNKKFPTGLNKNHVLSEVSGNDHIKPRRYL